MELRVGISDCCSLGLDWMLTKHELVQVDTSYLLIWPGTPSLDHRKAFCGTNVVVTFVRGLQYLAETQKLEELQLKQSRQFIPVVPKALVSELVLLSHSGDSRSILWLHSSPKSLESFEAHSLATL